MGAATDPPAAPGADAIDPAAMARLVAAARAARAGAVCEVSGFAVGAALLDSEGRVWTGANVENATLGLGVCAERLALFHALTSGARNFQALVIATDTPAPTPPCGACRQVLWEFARDAVVALAWRSGITHHRIADLLPLAFDRSHLG